MGEKTAIGWANVPGYNGATWNPWQGCTKVSAGCKNCYMYTEKRRYGQDPTIVIRSQSKTFNLPARLKEPHSFFVCSWSDFFHKDADNWRPEAWQIMRSNPQHLYLLCTKHTERMAECMPQDWRSGWPNVWLGATTENQKTANQRIPQLLNIPAKLYWLSVEPMLESIVVENSLLRQIDWVIVGGESGPKCRPMNLQWMIDLAKTCHAMTIPVYIKQLGGFPNKQVNNGDMSMEFPV